MSVAVGEASIVGVGVGDWTSTGVPVAVGEGVAGSEGVAVGVAEGGALVGCVADGVSEGVGVKEPVAVGEGVGVRVGVKVIVTIGAGRRGTYSTCPTRIRSLGRQLASMSVATVVPVARAIDESVSPALTM